MGKLTKKVVEGADVRPTDYFLWCDDLPGFGVRILPSGKRSYLVQYRAGGRSRRAVIGLHGRLTTDEARKEAMGLLGQVAKGGDPAEERATRRQSMTVAELCDRYLDAADKGLIAGKRGAKKPATLKTDRGRIKAHINPLLGRKLVRDLSHVDVTRFMREVAAGKTAKARIGVRGNPVAGGRGAAARTVGLLGGILSFAVSEGVIPANPAIGVKKPAYERRTARLSPDDYKALGKALAASEATGRPSSAIGAARLLALTGCRYAEVLRLTWAEVDGAGQALRLVDSKEGASTRPLGRAALDVLTALPRQEGARVVLPGRGEEAYGGFRAEWRRIAGLAGLSGVTPHTLRHSFASVAGDLGYSESTIGALLGHAAGTVTGRYTHHLDSVLIAAADKVAAEIAGYIDTSG